MMLYYGMLSVLLIMIAGVSVVGRRVCDLLPSRMRPVGRFYFSPILGIAVFMLLATLHGWVYPFKYWTTVPFTIILVGFCFYLEKDKTKLIHYIFILSLMALVISTTVLFPIIRFDSFNSFNDTFTYIVHGQWLQDHAFREKVIPSGNFPALTQVSLYQKAGHRMGASFFFGWVQSLFFLKWSYYAYPSVISMPLIAGALAIGGAVKWIIPRQRIISILTVFLVGITYNGFAFGSTYGFFPQTFGLALVVGAVALLGRFFGEQLKTKPLKKSVVQAVPISLVFAAFCFGYNDLLPFIGVGICLFLAIYFFYHPQQWKKISLCVGIIVLQVIGIINFEFIRIVRNFIKTLIGVGGGSHVIGWPVYWNPYEFIAHSFGFRSSIGNIWVFESAVLSQLILGVVLIGVLFFIFRFFQKKSPLFLINLSMVTVFSLGFLYFRYHVPGPHPNEVGHTFLQFKLSHWSTPFWFILFGSALGYLRNHYRFLSKALPVFLIVLILISGRGNARYSRHITGHFLTETGSPRSGFSTLLHLRHMAMKLDPEEVIYLNLGHIHHKLLQMVAYVLYDRKVAADYSDDGYILGHLPESERKIPLDKADWVVDFAGPYQSKRLVYPTAGSMILKRRPEALVNLISVSEGFSRETDSEKWWNWTGKSLNYEYKIIGFINKVKLRFLYMPATEGQNINLVIKSGTKESQISFKMEGGWNQYISHEIPVEGDRINIRMETDGEPIRVSKQDPRKLAYLIGNMEVYNPEEKEEIISNQPKVGLMSVLGGYDRETDGNDWRYWTDKKLILNYHIDGDIKQGRLRFTYMPASEGRKVKVIIKSKTKVSYSLSMKGGWNEFVSPLFEIEGSQLMVEVVSEEKPVRISENDPRKLSFLIQNAELVWKKL